MSRIDKAIILAAGVGSRIRPLTDNCPKTLLSIDGISILERMITNIRSSGIEEVILVLGYLHEQVESFVRTTFPDLTVHVIINERFEDTNTGYSLLLAEEAVHGAGFVKFDGDVVFDAEILRRLLAKSDGNHLCIDRNIQLDAEEVKVALSTGTSVALVSKALSQTTPSVSRSVSRESVPTQPVCCSTNSDR